MIRLNLGPLRASLDLHLSFGKDEPEDRYEDATGSHHQQGPITGFNFTRPEEM